MEGLGRYPQVYQGDMVEISWWYGIGFLKGAFYEYLRKSLDCASIQSCPLGREEGNELVRYCGSDTQCGL